MSDYQSQFDGQVQAAAAAINTHAAELQTIIPGFHPTNFRRLVNNISRLLGFVDRRQAAHPEYLAASPRNVPERAVETIAGVPASFSSGAAHFAQNVLPNLVDVEERLLSAVGGAAFTADQIRTQQVKAIEKLRTNASAAYNSIYGHMTDIGKWRAEASDAIDAIKQAAADSEADRKAVEDVRKLADKLSRGNASQNPLEKIVQTARDKFDEIENLRASSLASLEAATAASESAVKARDESQAALTALQATDEKADAILRNATQAGLAGAFKTERDALRKEQRYYAYTFYGIIAAVIIYALAFLLPIVREALGLEGEVAARESALMLFVRLVILAPVVWALVFTNRRFRYLETLQMDYAAKANTALAFSGYIDEVSEDPELTHELKRGLVRRFVEHPSRLLGRQEDTGGADPVRAPANLKPEEPASELEAE